MMSQAWLRSLYMEKTRDSIVVLIEDIARRNSVLSSYSLKHMHMYIGTVKEHANIELTTSGLRSF